MKKITHQIQPCQKSCVSTAIAMVLSVSASIVIKEFHEKFLAHKDNPVDYFKSRGVRVRRCYSDEEIKYGKVYLVTVPSLNREACNHEIVLDTRNDTVVRLFDPNMGNPGKKYYVWDKGRKTKQLLAVQFFA